MIIREEHGSIMGMYFLLVFSFLSLNTYCCPYGCPPVFLMKRIRNKDHEIWWRDLWISSSLTASSLSGTTGVPPVASRKIQFPWELWFWRLGLGSSKITACRRSYVASCWVPAATTVFWSARPDGLFICCSSLHVAIHRKCEYSYVSEATMNLYKN
jgi:hypothetical protein